MSFQILLTIQEMPGKGVVMFTQSIRPGVVDSRTDDEIRYALLKQAAVQAKEMIDKEMVGGDATVSALPGWEFVQAVKTLRELGMLEADVVLEPDDEEEL